MILHKGFQTVALIIVCILISIHVFAQDTDDFLVVGGSIALNFDGTNEFSYIVKDKDTGTFRYVSSIPQNRTISLTSSDSWPLTVDGMVRWPLGKTIEYGFTPDALQGNRKRIITDIIDTYVNGRRCTENMPYLKVTDRVDTYGSGTYLNELYNDGKNSIIITNDGRFSDSIGRVWWVYDLTTNIMEEVDLYLHHELMDGFRTITWVDVWYGSIEYSQKIVIFHEFGHVFGGLHTAWDNDLMLDMAQNVSKESFEDPTCIEWDIYRMRQRIYYDDHQNPTPRMLPLDKVVVDLTQSKKPKNVKEEEVKYYIYPVVTTTLKGYPDKPLTLKVYEGWLDKTLYFSSKGRIVAPSNDSGSDITGNAKPVATFAGYFNAYLYSSAGSEYWGSRLQIFNQQGWNVLHDLVAAKGVKQKLYHRTYSNVVPVTFVVSGYLNEEDNRKYSMIRHVYLVDTEDPWR